MNAVAMVNICFRHAYPELYDRDCVEEPAIPADLRHGAGVGDIPVGAEITDAVTLIGDTLSEAERLRAQQASC